MTSSAPRTVCYDWAKTFSLNPRRGRQRPGLTAEPVVIDYETFSKIHDCHDRQGLTIAQTARALGLHPRTVATWVARSRFEPRRSRPRSSVLDPFKPRIIRLLDSHPYSAQQIFQRLREEGYRGGAGNTAARQSKIHVQRQSADASHGGTRFARRYASQARSRQRRWPERPGFTGVSLSETLTNEMQPKLLNQTRLLANLMTKGVSKSLTRSGCGRARLRVRC